MSETDRGAAAPGTVAVPLDRDVFLRTLIRELGGSLEDIVGLEDASGFISVVGQRMGSQINQSYKDALSVDRLNRGQVAAVLVDLKRRIQGDFFVIEETEDRIVLGNRRCPFEEKVIGRPSMCMMTSNVFGSIAADNLGYAKVVLEQTIAEGAAGCRVTVYLKPTAQRNGHRVANTSPRRTPVFPENFLATADLLPEPMLLVTADGVIEVCNRAFARLLGVMQQELSGRPLDALVTESPEKVAEYVRACARSGQMVMGSLTLRQGDGSVAFRCDGVAYRAVPGGSPGRVLLRLRAKQEGNSGFLTLTDKVDQLSSQMARREQVEESLRQERGILEVTLASIGDGVIVTDAQGRVTFLNVVAQTLTGWTLQDASNKPLAEVFHIVNEQTGRPVEDPVAKVLHTGGIVGLANHTVLLSRDGRRVPIDDSAAPIRLADGELLGVVLIFRDISERKRAERHQAWLAAIVDSSDDAIASKTLDGTVTSWNSGAAHLFGYSSQEIIGKPIALIIPPELQEEERAILARLRQGERIEHFETVRVAKDARRIDISLTVSPIRDDSGVIVGASKVARDITAQKHAENALREADRRKDEFLATLAHELRNPLAPIRQAALISQAPEASEAQKRWSHEVIVRQVQHMSRLVDDLLDVSRITAGRIRLHEEPLDLAAVLSLAIESCGPALQSERHELESVFPEPPVYVRGDRVRLAQVFSNILGNAAKYTPSGGRISIEVRREADDAIVRVRDSGVGIPQRMLKYVFELFAQVDRSYDRTGGGLGIGLTLAKRLVEMHGGSIEARSEGPNKGSEFIVHLPAIDCAPASAVTADQRRTPEAARASRKVLIADDNQDAAMSLAMLVQMMGHETRIVHDGLAALEVAETFHPDIVLLDIGMPRLDGYETASRMAKRPWAASTLLIALTGWGQEADRQRAKAAGFHHHLVKPLEPETLSDLLSQNS
jgi:PAS domain S-box-containing protein